MNKTAEEIIQALIEPFDACELEFKTQPYAAVYIDARTPVKRLNAVLPGEWGFRLIGEPRSDDKGNISRDGCLTLYFESGAREYYATGTEEKDNSSQLKAEKGADSDTFKRCCFRVGIGAYIYELPKDIKQNQLTEAQLTQAARLAGYTGPIKKEHWGAMNKARAVVNETKPAPARETPAANGNGRPANLITEEEKERVKQAVENGGGNLSSATFLGWLAKNTANQAACVDEILSEDVDELVQKLEQIATKRNRAASS